MVTGKIVHADHYANSKWIVILGDDGKHYGANPESFPKTERHKLYVNRTVQIKALQDGMTRIAKSARII